MADHLVLLAPSSNRVYAGAASALVAAELRILLGAEDAALVEPIEVAGVDYLRLDAELDPPTTDALGRLSATFAVYRREGELLRPVALPRPDRFDDDLVTIPKYPGKTNEQFTRLLVNVTLASSTRPAEEPVTILDPMCGRGTTLSTAVTLGHDAAGVEADLKAIEAYAAFLRTYLRRKRLKHTAEMSPVRREGRTLGRRLDVTVRPEGASETRTLTVFSGDTRQSAALYGKRRFDAVVVDAPYGVVHGSQDDGGRRRSAAGVLAEALPVWATQLKRGGALGLAWNTFNLTRESLAGLAVEAGLQPLDSAPYLGFGHRVDSSIHRDVFVAVRP
ncbi:MAG: TRM11 family SAM-dependent methyltransferase [Friedmanniella sp.]